ncbi:MAG: hypothetical protein WAO82_08880 [Limnohabitans sp.]
MNIHQMSVQYDERQDRLALRVSNQDSQEFRLWLTRAMTLRLLPHLQASVVQLEARDPQVMAADTTAQQMLAELKRENFLSQADFSTPFVSQNLNLPLGATPLLVTDVQLNLHNSGSLNLLFKDKSGENASGASCEFNLQASLLHGLLHLIEQALKKAQWQQPDFSQRADNVDTASLERPAYQH